MGRRVRGMRELSWYAKKNGLTVRPEDYYDKYGAGVGKNLYPHTISNLGEQNMSTREVRRHCFFGF